MASLPRATCRGRWWTRLLAWLRWKPLDKGEQRTTKLTAEMVVRRPILRPVPGRPGVFYDARTQEVWFDDRWVTVEEIEDKDRKRT